MKPTIRLILWLILTSCVKQPQDSLQLKIQYRPETKYHYTSEQTLQTVIKYSGKPKSLQELKNRGFRNPAITTKKTLIEALIKTGKLMDDAKFPVTVDYKMNPNNNGQKESPVKVTFYGECLIDSIPEFDTVLGADMDKKYKKTLLQSWQKSFSQLSFSGEQLKIGEELSTENPFSLPMEGSEIETIVKTNYKLMSIKEGIADFDISQFYTMNPKLMDNSFKGTVKGKGELVYDLSNKIVLNYTLKTEMEIHKKLDSFDFQLNTSSVFVQTIRVINQ